MDTRLEGTGLKGSEHQKGVTLIIVILVMAFMLVIGMAAVSVTRTGPVAAVNVRLYQEAFNAAEAGFDAAWLALEGSGITSFDALYLTQPAGIDIPDPDLSAVYFRRLTDEKLLELFEATGVDENTPGMVYYRRTFLLDADGNPDPRITYTVFLIDDEAGLNMSPDPTDVLLVCIGAIDRGGKITTSRLEIVLAFQVEGS